MPNCSPQNNIVLMCAVLVRPCGAHEVTINSACHLTGKMRLRLEQMIIVYAK